MSKQPRIMESYKTSPHMTPDMLRMIDVVHGDINGTDRVGMTPLRHALRCNVSPELMQVLIDAGGNVDMVDEEGGTLLHYAISCNVATGLMRVLINAGGDVNKPDELGTTPVHLAAQNIFISKFMQVVIDAGGDLTIFDHYGRTAVDRAGPTLLRWLIAKGYVASTMRQIMCRRAQDNTSRLVLTLCCVGDVLPTNPVIAILSGMTRNTDGDNAIKRTVRDLVYEMHMHVGRGW